MSDDQILDVGKKLDLILEVLREKQQRSNGSGPVTSAEESTPESEQPTKRRPRTLSYEPVVTTARATEVVHAAITRRVDNRWRDEKFTLCDRGGKRVVGRVLRREDLDATVTCKQCRDQLVEDGMIDP